MKSGFIVRLRPLGPWRLGPASGARDRVDYVLRSDTLYSALTIAADRLGFLPEWLAATAEAGNPAVCAGSGFPFVGRTLLAPAPRHVWPPAAASKSRWKATRFVPLQLVSRLLAYETLKEDRWAADPVSQCVLPVEKFGEVTPPFRVGLRRTAGVDRVLGVSHEAATTACLEFFEGAGIWIPVACAEEWRQRVEALFRFVADSGPGGERSLGWGRAAAPEFEPLPALLTAHAAEAEHHQMGHWLLSLYAPVEPDRVDWTRGAYTLARRSGRADHGGELKPESAMVEEGSVVVADTVPVGFARNVASPGHSHPVYRAGFALSVPVAIRLPGFHSLIRAAEPEVGAEPAEDAPAVPSEAEKPEEPL